jgi:hypothetical protein
MQQSKSILFTFDYELFLGSKSGSIAKCVIEPTQKVLDIFSHYKISAIFFIDTTWLLQLKEVAVNHPPAKKDYDIIVIQLQRIAQSRHRVFPHIHPHWLDAVYKTDTNQWQLNNYSKYRFHSLDNNQREQLFTESINLLKDLIAPVKSVYPINGYRAGGWSIQPFEDFKPHFERHGIKYDFSVLPGKKNISGAQQYDFSDINTTIPYSFRNNVSVPGSGSFIEFPISTLSISSFGQFVNKVLLKYLWWTNDRSSGDGRGIVNESSENVADSNTEMIAIELLTSVKLPQYLNFLAHNNYMQFIAHPKMLSMHNINTFARFIKKAFALYSIETDFEKMLPE